MSQSTLPENAPNPMDSEQPQADSQEELIDSSPVSPTPLAGDLRVDDEFDYKPIPVLSPVTFVLGLTSLVVFVTAFGIIIGSLGVILGLICFLSSVRNRSEIGGFRMTIVGLLLSVATSTYGSAKLAYDYSTEVPEGYQRVSFSNDIAEKGFIPKYIAGQTINDYHPDVKALNGENIFLKGYMYPTRQTEEITEFILAKDNGDCCFGGEPKTTDMILIKLDKPLAVDFTDKQVSVAGEFLTNPNHSEGLTQVYEMKASHFTISKTAF